jgi:hypothetical protein
VTGSRLACNQGRAVRISEKLTDKPARRPPDVARYLPDDQSNL